MIIARGNFLQGTDSVIVRVFDLLKSKEWYRTVLGLKVSIEDFKYKLVVFDTGSHTTLTLWETDRNISIDRETTSYIIFNVLDAIATRNELQGKGVIVDRLIESDFVKYFFFYDPDGNIIEVCQIL